MRLRDLLPYLVSAHHTAIDMNNNSAGYGYPTEREYRRVKAARKAARASRRANRL